MVCEDGCIKRCSHLLFEGSLKKETEVFKGRVFMCALSDERVFHRARCDWAQRDS